MRRAISSYNQVRTFSATSSPPVALKALHVLKYTYVTDVLERRAPLRPLHLKHARSAVESNALVLGGAFNPPSEGGLLVFNSTRDFVENFAKQVKQIKEADTNATYETCFVFRTLMLQEGWL